MRRLAKALFEDMDLVAADALVAEDLVDHNPLPGQRQGRAGLRAAVRTLHAAFPDLQYVQADLIAEGDRVVERYAIAGTHLGPFLDLQPTKRTFAATGINLYRIADDRVVERWGQFDLLGALRQLGAGGGPQDRAPRPPARDPHKPAP